MLVVQGITNDGNRFRPSSWIDMLVGRYTCSASHQAWGNVSLQETQHCRSISKHIEVCCCNKSGHCEIRVSEELKHLAPTTYEHIKRFAITNNLKYTEGGDLNES